MVIFSFSLPGTHSAENGIAFTARAAICGTGVLIGLVLVLAYLPLLLLIVPVAVLFLGLVACYQGYFENSFLYKKERNNVNAYWWNGNLPETTDAYSLSPVMYYLSVPIGANSYKMTTWIN